jgi:hypothetical protein
MVVQLAISPPMSADSQWDLGGQTKISESLMEDLSQDDNQSHSENF